MEPEITVGDVGGIRVAHVYNNSGIVVFGIGVMAGSNFENPNIAGISHFAEHMFFKGTDNRNWRQINRTFAKLGVSNNAWTDNTQVYYYAGCPKENLEPVVELMTDILFNSTLPENEIEKERNVILEEKKMYDDDPNSYFYNYVKESFFEWEKGHNTIGTEETINNIKRQDIIDYLRNKYNRDNIIFVCCGDIKIEDLIKYIESNIKDYNHPYFNNLGVNKVGNSLFSNIINSPERIKLLIKRENTTQALLSMQGKALSLFDPSCFISLILYKSLGGGMYSLLNERLREELGLCYSIGIENLCIHYPNDNTYCVFGHSSPEKIYQFMDETEAVIKNVVTHGVNNEIFECAKIDLLASLLRQSETSMDKMDLLMKRFLSYEYECIDSIIKRIKCITNREVNDMAQRLFDGKYNWAVMVPKGDKNDS